MSHGNKQQWILAKRPEGMPDSSEVILQDAPIPETGPGMLLVKNHYISLDPAIRGWMSDIPNYLPPIPLGDPVRATVVGEVLESGSDNIKAGDYVFGLGGWETHSTIPVDFCTKVPDDNPFPLHYYVNILGAVGLTPYFAIADVGQAQAGQTMLMSAAAGAVGSVGGQIAKLMGLRVVGIAGTEEKCQWVVDELGFDDCINYRTAGDMEAAIRTACPPTGRFAPPRQRISPASASPVTGTDSSRPKPATAAASVAPRRAARTYPPSAHLALTRSEAPRRTSGRVIASASAASSGA